jgi:DNA-binding protein HU-beta
MNRKGFVDKVQGKFNTTDIFPTPISKEKTDKLLTIFLESIEEVVDDEGKLQLIGFGSFEKKLVKGREGVSHLKGEEKAWKTENKYKPIFSAGKEFKDKVNE